MRRGSCAYFGGARSWSATGLTTAQFNSARYIKQVQSLSSEFDKRFVCFASVEPIATYIPFPFAPDIDVEDVVFKDGALFQLNTTAVQNMIFFLQNSTEIKSRAFTKAGKIWELLVEEKHLNIKRCAFYILVCFGSTNLCEFLFSQMKIINIQIQIRYDRFTSSGLLEIATTSYCLGSGNLLHPPRVRCLTNVKNDCISMK